MKTVALDEVLPASAIAEIGDLANQVASGRITAREVFETRLCEILAPHEKYAEERGALISYLFYAVQYVLGRNGLRIPN